VNKAKLVAGASRSGAAFEFVRSANADIFKQQFKGDVLKLKFLAGAAIAAASLAWAASAEASTTIFSSFDPGPSYSSSSGWTVSTSSSAVGTTYSPAMNFTSPGDYVVTQIDLGLGNVAGQNAVDISLWTDAGGALGSNLGTWHVTGLPAFGSTGTALTTISGITGVSVHTGANYWLSADGVGDSWNGWNLTGAPGTILYPCCGTLSGGLGAFDVIGDVPTGVPEPATWISVILGFGALGLAMRNRRRRATVPA
jgi:hypothetical protein